MATVAETQYDADGEVSGTVAYGTPLSLAQVGAGATTATIAAALTGATDTRSTSTLYDAAGRVRATIAADGATSFLFYDGLGRLTATVDPLGSVVRFDYDGDGRLVGKLAYLNQVDTSEWIVDGVVVPSDATTILPPYQDATEDDERGVEMSDRYTSYVYDALGRLIETSVFVDDPRLIPNSDFTPNPVQETRYGYDGAGRIVWSADVAADPDHDGMDGGEAIIESRITRYAYDADGRRIGMADQLGNRTQFEYDAAGNLVRQTAYAIPTDEPDPIDYGTPDPLDMSDWSQTSSDQDRVTRYDYDALGRNVAQLDAAGYLTTYAYNGNGVLTDVTRYATALTGHEDDGFDALRALVAGTASESTHQAYNALGQRVSSTNQEGTVTSYTYDIAGHLTTTTVASGTTDARTTTATYDAYGDVTSQTDGEGNTTTYTFDVSGRVSSRTDALGQTTWFVYDADGQVRYSILGIANSQGPNALGELTQYAYDAFGDVTLTRTYAARFIIPATPDFTIGSVEDIAQAMVNESIGTGADPYTVDDSTLYDSRGNAMTRTNGLGEVSYSGYDAFGELVFELGRGNPNPSGYETSATLYGYDGDGHLVGEAKGKGYYSFGSSTPDLTLEDYDSFSNGGATPVELADNGVTNLQFAYNAFGDLVDSVDGNGAETSYTINAIGQRVATDLHMAGGDRIATSTYDAYGRVLTVTDGGGNTTTYTYDDVHRTVTMTAADGQVQVTTHDREGDIVSVADAAGQTTLTTYDDDGRVLSTTDALGNVTVNTYDAAGNLTSVTDARGSITRYTYDAAGRVLTEAQDVNGLNLVTTHTYDTAGRNTQVVDAAGDETDYTYDEAGQLTYQVTAPGDDAARTTASYVYDSQGRITQEYVNETLTYYQYDYQGRLIEKRNDSDYNGTYYSYDGDGNLTKEDGPNGVIFYVYNEAGQLEITARSNPSPPPSLASRSLAEFGDFAAITRNFYDAAGNLVSTRSYDQMVDVSEIDYLYASPATEGEQLADLRSYTDAAATSDDRVSYTVYGPGHQPRYTIDGTGVVTELRYNDLGQVTETLVYSTRLPISADMDAALKAGTFTLANMSSALSQAGASEAGATQTFAYYDADGRTRFVVTPGTADGVSGGMVSEKRYDANGNVIATLTYGMPLTGTNFGTATTASIAAAVASLPSRGTRTVYDGANRPVYSIDSLNQVTETRYDGDGRVLWTLAYRNAIPAGTQPTLVAIAAALQAANNTTTDIRATGQSYDGSGHVIATYNVFGGQPVTTSTYEYGQLAAVSDADGNTTTYQYFNGRLIATYGPAVNIDWLGDVASQSIETDYNYDGYGRLTSVRIWSGNEASATTSYQYDKYGNQSVVQTQSLAESNNWSDTAVYTYYDVFNQAVYQVDDAGRSEYKIYDADGRLAYDIDSAGYVTGYTYDTNGNQATITRYATPVDPSSVDPGEDGAHQITLAQMTTLVAASADDRTITTTYDTLGNKVSVQQPAVTYVQPNGSTATGRPTTVYTYDAYGEVTSEATLVSGTPGQAGAVWATTYHFYDAKGREVLSVDPMGYATQTTYDGFGDVASVTQYARAINTSGLVAGGAQPALPAAGDASTGLDRVTSYTYDSVGRKLTQTDLVTVTGADGSVTRRPVTTTYGYDGEGRTTSVDVDGVVVTTQYDGVGRVTSVTGPSQAVLRDNWQALLAANPSWDLSSPGLYVQSQEVVSYTYDYLGYKTSEVHSGTASGLTQATRYANDGAGNVTSTDSSLDQDNALEKDYTYDEHHNLLTTSYTLTGNDGTVWDVVIANTYDEEDHLTGTVTTRTASGVDNPQQFTDASSFTQYNAFGEPAASGSGLGASVTTTYDAAGRVISSTDPKTGAVHTYGYDLAGRLLTDTVATTGGTGTAVTGYTVDLDGRVTSQRAPSASAATGSAATANTATYDRWGNILTSVDYAGNTTSYQYDERNHVIVETGAAVHVVSAQGVDTVQTPTTVSGYDAQGNMVRTVDANLNVTTYVYNASGQVTSQTNGAGDVTLSAYDALGNEVGDEDGIGHITFKNVDGLGRVLQQGDFVLAADGQSRQVVWQAAYLLDENGDRIIAYDGIGAAAVQAGTDGEAHANFYGYDSQGRVIWSQDAVQRANSSTTAHTGHTWTQDLPNSGFEAGSTSWSYDAGWFFNVSGRSGLGVGFVNPGNGNSGTMYNSDAVPVVPGQTIVASVDVAQGTADSGDAGAHVAIIWYDADGNQVGVSAGNTVDSSPGGDGWDTSTVNATAPWNAAYGVLAVVAFNNTDKQLTVDNAKWNYVPPASALNGGQGGVIAGPGGTLSQTQILNPDFENGSTGWDTGDWNWVNGGEAGSQGAMGLSSSSGSSLVSNTQVPVVRRTSRSRPRSTSSKARRRRAMPVRRSSSTGTTRTTY